MEALLEFVYRGEVNVHAEDLESLMNFANSLEVEGLVGGIRESHESFQTDCKPIHAKDTSGSAEIPSKIYFKKSFQKSVIPLENMGAEEHKSSLSNPEDISADIILDDSSSESFNVLESNNDHKEEFPMSGYDEIVQDLVTNTGKLFNCRECPYSGSRGHVQEHVERHIKGFVFPCDVCRKTFERRATLRTHMYRCTRRMNNSAM